MAGEAISSNSSISPAASSEVSIPITTLSPTTYIAFVLDGDHTSFDYWYIDNVKIEAPEVCNWEIWLHDTFGDGWNGALMDVLVDTHAIREIGWSPTVNLEEGLAMTVVAECRKPDAHR